MKLKATVFSVRGIILTAITDEAQELSYIAKSLENIGWKCCPPFFFFMKWHQWLYLSAPLRLFLV